MFINKWVTLVACIPVMLGSGAPYTFSVWSDSLKEAYSLSQTQLATVGSLGGLGAFLAVIAGLVYDRLAAYPQLGPRVTLIVGGVTNLLGYLALWAAVERLFVARFWQLPILFFAASSGMTWFDSSCIATNVRNFPSHRGLVIGVLKSGLGISGSLFTTLYMGLLQQRGSGTFLLLMAILPSVAAFAAALVANHVPFDQESEIRHHHQRWQGLWSRLTTENRFLLAIAVIGGLAVYLMGITVVACLTPTTLDMQRWFSLGALFMLLPLLLVPLGSGGLFAKPAHLHIVDEEGVLAHRDQSQPGRPEDSLLAASHLNDDQQGNSSSSLGSTKGGLGSDSGANKLPPVAPSLSPLQCLTNLDFWLLFLTCLLSNSMGLVLSNNLAQIVRSLGGPENGQDLLVSLFGVGNCTGRLLMGYVSEKALHASGVPRPLFLVFASGATTVLGLLLAYSGLTALYPVTLGIALVFGAFWSLMPSLASELFGLKHFATNYTMFQLAPAFSGMFLGSWLAGALYDRAIARHGTGGITCFGTDCFRPTFLIIAGLCAAATVCATKLYFRTSEFYHRVTYTAVHQHDLDVED